MDYGLFLAPSSEPCIKEESFEVPSLLSSSAPCTTGHILPLVPSSSHRRASTSCASARKHSRPYPLLERGVKHSGDIMSHYPWSASSGRKQHQSGRATPAPENFGMPHQYINEPYVSSSSSSLMGAMGDMSLQPRQPHSSKSGHIYSGSPTSELGSWSTQSHMQPNVTVAMSSTAYPGVAGHGGLDVPYPGVAGSSNTELLGDYPSAVGQSTPAVGYGPQQAVYGASPSLDSGDEVQRLRRRIQELEREVSRSRSTIENLRNTVTSAGLPLASSSQTAAFQSSWNTRTEARKRIYCSLNRAGNALCAWHDSRRERRAYPPRNAPPGHLNCGCTYEEALFEESLARHGVGSYLPGDMVRMDPALRNPLLNLLQRRYGYKDGDFEHDPVTLTWAEGESPATWDKKAQGGAVVKRRTESDRH